MKPITKEHPLVTFFIEEVRPLVDPKTPFELANERQEKLLRLYGRGENRVALTF